MSKFKYEGSYVVHRRAMLESDAYRSLGKTELKILARLEIEIMRHRGMDNGCLICTYDDFAEYGVRRPSIPQGLRRLRKVGLLVVTQRGRRDALRNPHHYRLTYLPLHNENGIIVPPTDEWRRYKSPRKAKQIGRSVQKPGNENVPGTGNENVPGTGNENVPKRIDFTGNENVPTFYKLPVSTPEKEQSRQGPEPAAGIGHNAGPPMGDMAGETAEPARCNCLICGGDDANATCINQLDAFSVDARQNAPARVDDLAIPAFLRRY